MMMTPKALKALKGSIKKWEGIVAGTVSDEGTKNCPLCRTFHNDFGGNCCKGCPVRNKTDQPECRGSPYIDEWDGEKAITDGQIVAAVNELRFLRSLLPKSQQR